MRIAGFFLRLAIILLVVGGLSYFLIGYVWLAWGSRAFLADVRFFEESIAADQANAKKCLNAPASSRSSLPIALQFRFLDDRSYTIELLCSLIEDSPIELRSNRLPPFITKLSGSSGFYVDLENPGVSGITLASFRAQQRFVFSKTSLLPQSAIATIETIPQTSLPQSVCAGFGYQCCAADAELGDGTGQTGGVTDCPGRCFSSCTARPYITSFVADPYPDPSNTVRLSREQLTVTFSYSADLVGGTIDRVSIDYGDGETEEVKSPTGVFSHTYRCASMCSYTATVTAYSQDGLSSLANTTSTLYIQVQ